MTSLEGGKRSRHELPAEARGLAVTLDRTDDYSVGSQVPQ